MKYVEHPLFESPTDPEATVWRYVDFAKLVSLLESGTLFFSRSDLLGDEFEGSSSEANIALRPEVYGDDFPAEAIAQMGRFAEASRAHTYVNCWNLGDHESAALWGLYVPPSGGVAIRSTFGRLTRCFVPKPRQSKAASKPDNEGSILIGKVRYADYQRDWIPEGNSLWPFVHKRVAFEFENEVRAVIQDFPSAEGPNGPAIDLLAPSSAGLAVPIDLVQLIDAVVVSPAAPSWFAELTAAVCERYGLDKPVIASGLAGSPVF